MKKITMLLLFMPSLLVAQNFTDHIVDNSLSDATSTFIIDLDSDGDEDLLVVTLTGDELIWFENDGAQNFTKHIIDVVVDGAISVTAGDIDGDNDEDILVNAYYGNAVYLYMNDGAQNFTKQTIDASSTGSNYGSGGDFNSDGDVDIVVVANGGNELAWYENDGGSPTITFTKHIIDSSLSSASSVERDDIDNDGDDDLLVTSFTGNEVAWYENDGTGTFTKHSVATTFMGASTAYIVDIDGDNNLDFIASASIGDEVAWFESDGATLPTFTKHTIDTTIDYASYAQAVDFNNDGFIDVVASATQSNELVWYENDGAQNFTKHIAATAVVIGDSYGLHTKDIDGDGDFDIAVTAPGPNDFFWFENDFITIPDNDLCANATMLIVYNVDASIGNEIIGNTTDATNSPISLTSCDGVVTNHDVFYEFTVPMGETGVVVYTAGTVGNQIEAVLLDSCGGSEIVGTCQANNTTHLFEGLTAGQTYILQMWHDVSIFSDNRGEFTIAIESIPPTPSNDLCTNPINLIVGALITENVITGNNINTTDSGEITPTCTPGDYNGGDMWYSAIIPASGELIIETLYANGWSDGGLAVYSGTCGSLTQIDCNDDNWPTRMSKVTLSGQTPNDVVLIRVWELDNNRVGKFNVVAYDPNLASIDDLAIFDFNYYPNPVTDKLTLTANKNITSVAIYTLLGQEIRNVQLSSLEIAIDLTNLSSGTYYMKTKIEKTIGTFKIIKK